MATLLEETIYYSAERASYHGSPFQTTCVLTVACVARASGSPAAEEETAATRHLQVRRQLQREPELFELIV